MADKYAQKRLEIKSAILSTTLIERSYVCAKDDRARQLGNFRGTVVTGWSLDNPWQAKPNVYPSARATGKATAFPTCMYLKNRNGKDQQENEQKHCWKVYFTFHVNEDQIQALIARENCGIETINMQFKFTLFFTFISNPVINVGFPCVLPIK